MQEPRRRDSKAEHVKIYIWIAISAVAWGALVGGRGAAGQALPVPGAQAAVAATSNSTVPSAATPTGMPGQAQQTGQVSAVAQAGATAGEMPDAVKTLLAFKSADVKFDVARLMEILSDKRHEGWVLAAYPDPKTAQPLIGAGFSLDLPERAHPQRDPLNPHVFLEPSSAELWQAAGLEPARLTTILTDFNARLAELSKTGFRRQIGALEPQISNEDANALLRMGIIQAALNAKAYCRSFDRMSASQQMAMTQLVYQMGVNLEEFSSFLTLINRDSGLAKDTAEAKAIAKADAAYWRSVQLSLVQSQWARLYRARATAVIAMLDPRYETNPAGAEHSIGAILRPAVSHRRRGHSTGTLRNAAYHRPAQGAAHRRKARTRSN
jgi:hypothetical protein